MYNFVVLCGGSGSRLWPKSRAMLPKQLLSLTSEKTMLQNTILRIQKWMLKNEELDTQITIICNKDHAHIVDIQIIELNLQMKTIIYCEPIGRDSAPAICIASLLNTSEDNTFILPCDHIFDDDEFVRCCIKATEYLNTSIVTFGIKPDIPETGYGYIQIGENSKTEKFIENCKPIHILDYLIEERIKNNIPNDITIDIVKNIKRNLKNNKKNIYESETSKEKYDYYRN